MNAEDREIENALYERVKEYGGKAEWAIAYSLWRMARSTENIAYQLKMLGNADADTPMGGLEALGKVLGDALDNIATSHSTALDNIAEAIDKIPAGDNPI